MEQNEIINEEAVECQSAKNLKTFATTILVIGIVCGCILFFSTMFVQDPDYTYKRVMIFNPGCFTYLLGCLVPALSLWVFANAIADITNDIHKIANKK